MHRGTTKAGAPKVAARRGFRRLAGPAVALVVAFGVASLVASSFGNVDNPVLSKSNRLAQKLSPVARIGASFFELRFAAREAVPTPSEAEIRLAKKLFSQTPGRQATYQVASAAPDGGIAPAADSEQDQADTAAPAQTAIPLPRPRPAEAGTVAVASTTAARDVVSDRPEDPTLIEKLSGMFKYRMTLASLTPTEGIFAPKADLAALGYDNETAVYDISNHVVYLPNGAKLEAHSGLGGTRDDPAHVSEHSVGATPPAVYELKPRESLFHGVQALRMNPVEGSALGRTGLLVHPYMLGPNGDSNGCVSVRDYDRFLAAYQHGDFKRLAVVPNLAVLTKQSSL
jgi:type VI secretion system (T6SS) effector TldE1-like protein